MIYLKIRELKIIERKTWKTKDDEKDPTKRVYQTAIPNKVTKFQGINLLDAYLKELNAIKPGKRQASQYHNVVFNILKSIFENRLRKPKMGEELAGRSQRADITFQNQREKGFFKQLAGRAQHIVHRFI